MQMADQKEKLSFGFHKKVTPILTSKPKLGQESRGKDSKETKDYVLSIADQQIESSNLKPKKGPLIIPLIVKNNWRLPSTVTGSNVKSEEGASELDKQAVQEILKATQQSRSGDVDESTLVIPVFVQNQIPQGFETDEKVDVSLRAEEPTMDDYERIPIEEYGAAMLRGMGWKPEEGIGSTNKRVVKPPEATLRPKGLGLGADSRAKSNAASLVDATESLTVAVGAYVKVLKGPHKDLYGQVDGLDVENARVVVKLALTSKNITISEYLVTAVTKHEYKRDGKIINKAEYDEYRVKAEECFTRHKSESKISEDRSRSSRRERHKDRSELHREEKGAKRKYSPDSNKSKTSQKASHFGSLSWVRPLLRARFIDRAYKGGKYYNSKFVIEDVVNNGVCICRTDSGRILDDVPEQYLETLIPRKPPLIVMIVKGTHRGQLAEILSKEKDSCMATVQLVQDKDVVQLDFDSICEYSGIVSDM